MAKNKNCNPCEEFKTMIGGQALIEGIMMRGPEKNSIVVRKEDGSLTVKTESYIPRAKKNKIWGIPVIRGFINFVDSMSAGMTNLLVRQIKTARRQLDILSQSPSLTSPVQYILQRRNALELRCRYK